MDCRVLQLSRELLAIKQRIKTLVDIRKALIVLGIILIVSGLLWPWLGKIPLGRLPGDIVIERPNMRFYFPITTMILISLVISLILWLFRR